MYSKDEQLKRNGRLKPKPYKSKDYLAWFHKQGLGCMVCQLKVIEAHHIFSGARGRQDDKIVPLCPYHHRILAYSAHGADAKLFREDYPQEFMEAIADQIFKQYMEETDAQAIR